ncbi:MCE family protein [Actinokineospora iranica]|uniref:Phospholipid/cholesterol/gamma-HCH transport system substrate-binding protein n=1 Tax=Actinokineospora iranica TaxID=1271860 RepID=A0A1G6YR61_9PSEU|nr:MCE family protein [Actinokineospora iranica]SDD92984.1 phospholipid/cholesterol/gamma-HCH transport system substrate-binding protein [Actinokineospora iranica]
MRALTLRRTRQTGKAVTRAAVLALGATLLAGCGSGLYGVDLPGGADLGDHPYRVTADFKDVLDLVPQSGVKVDDVTVGKVEAIELAPDGRIARVTLAVNGSVRLSGTALARLRQSSVLGEKFVELDDPAEEAREGVLADGANIPVERTNRNTEIEEVFGALSMLLNGGGVGQLQQINRELNAALNGNESDIHALLTNLNTFAGGLDSHRGEIVRALDGLDRLSTSLAGQSDKINGLLDNLTPGIKVLSEQRTQFVNMLNALNSLSGVATDVIKKSKDNIIADLRALEPTLRKLNEAGQQLPQAMELLFTFPFTDGAMNAIKGDYINTYLSLNSRTHGQGRPAPASAPLPLPSADLGRPETDGGAGS